MNTLTRGTVNDREPDAVEAALRKVRAQAMKEKTDIIGQMNTTTYSLRNNFDWFIADLMVCLELDERVERIDRVLKAWKENIHGEE